MQSNRRIPLLAGGIISLLVLVGLLGVGTGALTATQAAPGGKHRHGTSHTKPHPKYPSPVPDHVPPFCFPTAGNIPTSVSVKCLNFDGFTPPFTLTVTPDCAALMVVQSDGTVLPRNGGAWVLPFPPTGTLSFSLDGTGCANGTYQLSVTGPGGGLMASFSHTF